MKHKQDEGMTLRCIPYQLAKERIQCLNSTVFHPNFL